jgi:hypothetical protein
MTRPLLDYTPPPEDPKRTMGREIVSALKATKGIEEGLDKLDIGQSTYRTLIVQAEEANRALARLNETYQRHVYRRPQGQRNINHTAQVQMSPRRG